MTRDPEDRTPRPADRDAVRRRLIDLGLLSPVVVSERDEQVLALPDFDDSEAGRRAFAEAMRGLVKDS